MSAGSAFLEKADKAEITETFNTSKQLLRSERVSLLSQIYTTVNSFADLSIQEFRREIELCFVRVFELAERWSLVEKRGTTGSQQQPHSCIHRYDACFIQDALLTIDWRKCCTSYNLVVKNGCDDDKTASFVPSTTALEVLLQLFREGRCYWEDKSGRSSFLWSQIQAACIPIVSMLFKVATSSAYIYNSPSGSFLRDTISTIILRAAPSTSFVDIIVKELELRLRCPSSCALDETSKKHALRKYLKNFSYDEALPALELSVWLCKTHVGKERLGPPLAALLVTTFSDLYLLGTMLPSQKSQHNISTNNEPNRKYRAGRNDKNRHRGAAAVSMRIHHLSDHHERLFNDFENNESSILIHTEKYKDGREIERAKLRDEVEQRRRQTLQSLGRTEIKGEQPQLSKKESLSLFLEKLLECLLNILHLMNLHYPYESKYAVTFRAILAVVCQERPRCLGASLCAMAAASLRTDGMLLLMQQLWASFLCNVTKNFDHLRRYSDFVVDCRHFDDPVQCWIALDTLTSLAFRIATRIRDGSCCQSLRKLIIVLGRAIFHILVHRRTVLSKDNFEARFSDLLTKLSFHFGENIQLLLQGMTSEEKEFTIEMCCATGIVSFVEGNALNEECVDDTSLDITDRWPFPSKYCIQSSDQLAHRIASNFLSLEKDKLKRRRCTQAQCDEMTSPPYLNNKGICVMEMINEDIILKIFSFFGYRRITKLGEVCKEWRSVGQSAILWQQLYARRWPNAIHDPFAFPTKASFKLQCWKAIFIKKWQVERGVRSKYSSDGWKHRTCDYIGCTSVLRSQQQSVKHSQKHEKDSTKRKLSHERQEAAKAMKMASKKAKQSHL